MAIYSKNKWDGLLWAVGIRHTQWLTAFFVWLSHGCDRPLWRWQAGSCQGSDNPKKMTSFQHRLWAVEYTGQWRLNILNICGWQTSVNGACLKIQYCCLMLFTSILRIWTRFLIIPKEPDHDQLIIVTIHFQPRSWNTWPCQWSSPWTDVNVAPAPGRRPRFLPFTMRGFSMYFCTIQRA